ncbi:uncharacterized protein TM35_000072250 [Trypanosoma theileri]|uniref:Leucine-rich repeat protein (LRRP) n=1 Tax=Trypanosoma theileri TaxID=67003 RepID=A0A1X0NDL1_9TRYP|nr:uncharacterized protein TM35_002261010 [Trypanosoma theileri]XP_028884867.1 uncharacterized protein TM35_000072250 [Trypanosoma theileri]ORC78779.1 hypothetical protein TM35_002261010 [Trypanosoma theileri]ORC90801.1 hypothetical protein TM35_000072250 [Trypanosoma theileri]
MIVDEARHFIDFSNYPGGVLDEEILSQLRDALNCNDHFCKLVFNNNRLTDDAVGTLAAILKGRTPIEYLSLEACDLRDVDILHIANAVCTRKALKFIDLRRNPAITSEALPDIARMIRSVPTLTTILMRGTSLQPHNCAEIMDALEQSSSVKVMELPYTVGYRVLDNVKRIISKNNMEYLDSTSSDKNEKRRVAATIGSTSMETSNKRRKKTLEPTTLPKLVPPPPVAFSAEMPPTEVRSTPPLSPSLLQQKSKSTVEMMEFRHWADPAIKNAAAHIYVLDQRCQLLEMHKQEKRERLLAKRGLMPRQKDTEWSTQYYRL